MAKVRAGQCLRRTDKGNVTRDLQPGNSPEMEENLRADGERLSA